ncbi:putative GMC oxidoreductase [Cryomyces antarcticus]
MNGAEEYDYIICGGGTAGCVVAARLAAYPEFSVLVIEAGKHNEALEHTQMVGGWSKGFDTSDDWNIVTTPNPSFDGRQVKCSRGRYLGGSSGCNGTLCIRGTRQDYDDWQIPGWSGEEVFQAMSKAETFHTKPWFQADEKSHGTNGLLHTEPHDLAPISNLLMESFQSQGLPYECDMFSHGNNPNGCGHAPRTVYQGTRTTGADFVSKTNARDNVHVRCETLVDKIVLETVDGELKATGVKIVDEKSGVSSVIRAKKEVIVAGGSYCSPAILLRSGIGAKEEVKSFGIESTIDLPGVGKNLMDHLIVFMFYETEKAGLTNDFLLYHDNALESTYKLWLEEKKGPLSSFPFGAFAFARLDERLKDEPLWKSAPRENGRDPMGLTTKQPNIEFFTTECYGGPKQYDQFPIDRKHAFSMIAELFAPRSRGTVTLKSSDPRENPVVDHNYLADPLDMLVLSEACRFGNEIVTLGAGTKDIVKGSWPPNLTHHTYTEREQWEPFVRQHATTCYHPGGTCKMGKSDDPLAVVDERLRVRGVANLRVADVSVMPKLNQGHTQMPAYGIGERAADLIMEDAEALNVKVKEIVGSLNATKADEDLIKRVANVTTREVHV